MNFYNLDGSVANRENLQGCKQWGKHIWVLFACHFVLFCFCMKRPLDCNSDSMVYILSSWLTSGYQHKVMTAESGRNAHNHTYVGFPSYTCQGYTWTFLYSSIKMNKLHTRLTFNNQTYIQSLICKTRNFKQAKSYLYIYIKECHAES